MWLALLPRQGLTRALLRLCAGIMAEPTASAGGETRTEEERAAPELKLFNSLSRKKEKFVPMDGKKVTWYSCGPTVYDASHMGHARSYITFDILRRVMVDYFKYDVFYVMNITDIDDKIINRARQNYLLERYKDEPRQVQEIVDNVTEALQRFDQKAAAENDKDKKAMLENISAKAKAALEASKLDPSSDAVTLIKSARDPLANWLDYKYGASVTDHKIFSALTHHWEEDYHKDMESLNVQPPDVLTRVSEYVPEVVEYVEKIIDNGYAYESNGSVYFDTVKFSSSPKHRYRKLVPEAAGDMKALAEGEGELSISEERLQEKKSRNDFALWKASKPGEPAWPSPWGPGRPGWHIECSTMACAILGSRADIHTGGVDLKFPHHDNEIAQAEAYFQSDEWITYFLHSGHLTIEGCKMSKSLKNFITIKEALKQYTPQQLRLTFLHHAWHTTLDFSENTMQVILHIEKTFNEFFLTVKDVVLNNPDGAAGYQKWTDLEKELNARLYEKCQQIHTALCDSIDTPTVMRLMKELVLQANVYLANAPKPNAKLLEKVAQYLTYLFQVFGVVPQGKATGFSTSRGQEVNQEKLLVPYLNALANFRESVRQIAIQDNASRMLQLCDELRDDTLVELGVRLEDKKGKTVVKLVGRETLLREREAEQQMIKERQRAKEEQKRKLELAQQQKEAQSKIRPEDLFRTEVDKYGQFDENGVPTHDASGKELSDKQRKKLLKAWQAQEKKHKAYLEKLDKN